MGVLMVPDDPEPWPSLGPQVCAFIEAYAVHGPGSLRGQPVRLHAQNRALIHRAYEVYPKGHPRAGRRRFTQVVWSLRKGSAKTEDAALVAFAELHPEGPVRFAGWDANGQPVGMGVTDPYIPMVAYTEEQTEDLAYAALYVICSEGGLADDFDIGLERIMRVGGDGKAVALAAAPDSRDGARTTFQHKDETHRFVTPRLREASQVMDANLPKRALDDPWGLETTTAPMPGEGSVGEQQHDHALAIEQGKVKDRSFFFFHREAAPTHDLNTDEGLRAAVVEASGPAVAAWSGIEGICDLYRRPTTDRRYFERVWLNRRVAGAAQAFDVERWRELADPAGRIPDGALVTAGLDPARTRDSTGLVVTEVRTGRQEVHGFWERPEGREVWELDEDLLEEALDAVWGRFDCWLTYIDPFEFEDALARWQGRRGRQRVQRFAMSWRNRKATALMWRRYRRAMVEGSLSHDGDRRMAAHIGASQRRDLPDRDDEGQPLWVVQKERDDSPLKIDLAAAGALSWEARAVCIAAGADLLVEEPELPPLVFGVR